jgi:predicted RNase H-like HicB family nuclease
MDGGVHGKDALKVFKELCAACDEVIEIYEEDGVALPAPKEIVLQAA